MSFNSKELLTLQRMVVDNPPNKLVYSEQQLLKMAYPQAQRYLTIVNESVSLVNNTVKPDVFFSRYELIEENLSILSLFEPYIKFKGNKPSSELDKLQATKQEQTLIFLARYFSDTKQQADNMKTDKGKLNKYEKFYQCLKPYYNLMNSENIDYIETNYKSATFKPNENETITVQCKNCKAEVNNGSGFCPYCHSKLEYPTKAISTMKIIAKPLVIQCDIEDVNNNRNIHTNNHSRQRTGISNKSKWITLILAIFLGYIGIHRFYVGKNASGVLYIFTVGLLYIGWISDIVKIAKGQFTDGNGLLIKK